MRHSNSYVMTTSVSGSVALCNMRFESPVTVIRAFLQLYDARLSLVCENVGNS